MIYRSIASQIPKQGPFLARPLTGAVSAGIMSTFVKPRVAESFQFVDDELKGREFFVGDQLTGADSKSSEIPTKLGFFAFLLFGPFLPSH